MAEQTPGWHPDPSGRHQHRFWDGRAWTDSVADEGHVAADPLGAPPGGAPDHRRRGSNGGRSWAPWAVGAAAATLVVVIALVLVTSSRSGGGSGPTVVDLGAGTPANRTIHLHAGEAAGFEVRAESKDVRFRVAIATDGAAHAEIAADFAGESSDPYDSNDYSDFFVDGPGDRRLLFAGRSRGTFAESFVAPATGSYTLAVRPEEAVRLRLDIETQTKPDLASRYSPVALYRLRQDRAYRSFFKEWDRRSQGVASAFTDFSDPYPAVSSDRTGNRYSDYLSEYSDYLDDSGNSDNSS